MGGANTGGGAGGNTGADAGFFISEQRKKEKINESGYGADYQGDVNPQKKQKKKTVTTINNNNGGEGAGAENVLKGNAVPGGVGGPTKAEVSQSEAANADADTEANRLLKIKKKGRSQSIISGSQGVTKTSTDYSLGKKSLLGRV
jgi:hypothetical protein